VGGYVRALEAVSTDLHLCRSAEQADVVIPEGPETSEV